MKNYYFKVTFDDGKRIYRDGLTKRQAVLRYNKWCREAGMLPIKIVAWGVMK